MTYKRFEDLPVWQEAIELAKQVYSFTKIPVFRGYPSLKDQIERASLSVSNNIAEGFERGTTKELLTFLYIARGSAGEVRSVLCFIEQLPEFKDFNSEISSLKSISEGISRQLRAWADTLQNSEIPGQRYLTEKGRELSQKRKEQDEFLKQLNEIVEKGRGKL
ncbi:hypothetical protein JZK55_10750 [Dissulfurispira thermophila]|uniref:Four helix bundle protein n=2 Tax=root TaxID=1 RepID=A0A7G1H1W9_9BACT|nr:four helix bundle protein [Dissulfurispira thermophila]BCB96153.1 hypothetical protein JZK55_10750 [Dissulfurispira thermophila]